MIYHFFTKRLDEESVAEAIAAVEAAFESGKEITICLNSRGGSVWCALLLLHHLNKRAESVTLIAGAGIYSAMFSVFYRFEGKRLMIDECVGMIHVCTNQIEMTAAGVPSSGEDHVQFRNMTKAFKSELDFAKSILTHDEMSDFERLRDVFLPFNRMKEIFPNVEIIK